MMEWVVEEFIMKIKLLKVDLHHQKDLGLYQISPGKAFVRGWEIETINSSVS